MFGKSNHYSARGGAKSVYPDPSTPHGIRTLNQHPPRRPLTTISICAILSMYEILNREHGMSQDTFEIIAKDANQMIEVPLGTPQEVVEPSEELHVYVAIIIVTALLSL